MHELPGPLPKEACLNNLSATQQSKNVAVVFGFLLLHAGELEWQAF